MTKYFAEVRVTFEAQEIMDAVFENLFKHSSPWLFKYRYDSNNPEKKVPVCYENPDFSYGDPTQDEWKYTHIGPGDLARGLGLLLAAGQRHCFGIVIPADFEEWDTCCADECLQYAIFGKSIFG